MTPRFLRTHLAVTLAAMCVTAWFSYAYFHIDEYFQVIELVRFKLGQVGDPLPWEHTQRLRPWLQPFLYWLVARVVGLVGVHDVFTLAFVFRLVTGLANVFALGLFLRTTLPWMPSADEKRLHVRAATLLGFLPYLFVRTSSESASMAALTAGWALLLEGAAVVVEGGAADRRRWNLPALGRPGRLALVGGLLGVAFELRFQTAIFTVGVVAWSIFVGGARARSLAALAFGVLGAFGLGAVADRWGYGSWELPAWSYFQANIVEGAAGIFGTDPPFAYLWLLPANVFLPVVLGVILLAVLAWVRAPRHPLTWATLPFFLVHNLLAHKEERFLFPLAILATGLVTIAVGPSFAAAATAPGGAGRRADRVAAWAWRKRRSPGAKLLAVWSVLACALLMFVPLGWHQSVRFTRFCHERFGDEFHATALPEINLNLPPYRPRVYDVDKLDPEELSRRIETHTAPEWLVADRPMLATGTLLDARAELVYSELPGYRNPRVTAWLMRWVTFYNARAPSPLRQLHYRSLFRIPR